MKELNKTDGCTNPAGCNKNTSFQQTAVVQGEALKKVCTGVLGIPADRVSVVHLQNQAQLQAFARQWKDSNK